MEDATLPLPLSSSSPSSSSTHPEEEAYIDRLNEDMWGCIFEMLSLDDMHNVRLVCRHWNAVAMKLPAVVFQNLMPDTCRFLQEFEVSTRAAFATAAEHSQHPAQQFAIDWREQLVVEKETREAMLTCKDQPLAEIYQDNLLSSPLWTRRMPDGFVVGLDSRGNTYRIPVTGQAHTIINASGLPMGANLQRIYEHQGEKFGVFDGGLVKIGADNVVFPVAEMARVCLGEPNSENSGVAALLHGGEVTLVSNDGTVVKQLSIQGSPLTYTVHWRDDRLYAGHNDGRIEVWNVSTGERIQNLRYSKDVTGLHFRTTQIIGKRVFLHSEQACLRVKELGSSGSVKKRSLMKILKVNKFVVRNEMLVTVTQDEKVTCRNLITKKRCWSVTERGFPVCLNIVDDLLLIGKTGRSVAILSMRTGEQLFAHVPVSPSRLDEIRKILWHEGRLIVMGIRGLTIYPFRSSISAHTPTPSQSSPSSSSLIG